MHEVTRHNVEPIAWGQSDTQSWRPLLGDYHPQPEMEQALLRVMLGALSLIGYCLVAMLHPTAKADAMVAAFLGYAAIGVAIYVAVRCFPAPSRTRVRIAVVIDQASLILALAVGGRLALPMLWAIFWLIVGTGGRYGKRMLMLSGGVALIGIAGLMRWESWWKANPEVGLGLFISVAATCLYLIIVMQRRARRVVLNPRTDVGGNVALEAALARTPTIPGGELGDTVLLLIDVDGFQQVAEAYGQAVGDALLQRIDEQLPVLLRRDDTVLRWGDGAFVVLARHIDGQPGAQALANGMHRLVGRVDTLNGHQIDVSASIGVCMLGMDDTTSDVAALMRRVNGALYRAKRRGKGQTEFADEDRRARSPTEKV